MKEFVLFKIDYFAWHYSQGITDITTLWRNVLWAISNFFSVGNLLKSLFSPWKQLGEERTKSGLDMAEIATATLVGFIMRLVGFLIRILFILLWVVIWTTVFILGPVLFVFWLILPVLGVGLFVMGIALLFM